ncbi:MAG TPA: hypothetical protein VHK65_10615 [Candidatus Dormibacteraeota bacterium]|nr:hypothetical protein [Candidatus Dormibacteraeota bacterium]
MTQIRPVNGVGRLGTLAMMAVIAATDQSIPQVVAPVAATRDVPPPTNTNPADLASARTEILGWVAAEEHPTREWGRLFAQNPDTTEHNFRVAFAVNYALLTAGAKPGMGYTAMEFAAISERALWTLTRDLREGDPRIHSSESLVLRDAQRYLYGSLGDRWLQQYVVTEYAVPKGLAPYIPGWVISRGYEDVVKRADMLVNAIEEEITGTNPGWGRITRNMPHSQPGGEAWYDRGLAQFKVISRYDGSIADGSPFIAPIPSPAPRASVRTILGDEYRET